MVVSDELDRGWSCKIIILAAYPTGLLRNAG